MRVYQLATVTYGTKAAASLAMMTLLQLASNERENCPEAAQVLENNLYMDDLIYGSYTVAVAMKLKQDLIDLLKSASETAVKFHPKRVIGEQKLTHDEYATLLTQMEACLNLRPLCPLTDDPDDLNYTTTN